MIIPVSGNLSECEKERVQTNLRLLNFKIQRGGFGQPENWLLLHATLFSLCSMLELNTFYNLKRSGTHKVFNNDDKIFRKYYVENICIYDTDMSLR